MADTLTLNRPPERRRELWRTGSLAVLGFVMLFHQLGASALFEPDEGRNAEVAREMVVLGDWVTPHYDFIPYLDKPIGLFWLIALSYKLFGVSAWAARLPSALSALGCLILTYDLARARLGVSGALWAGLILVTCPATYVFGRVTIFDMTLTCCITAALWAYDRAARTDGRVRRGFIFAACGALGCATLVKGPIGLGLPGLVIVLDLILARRLSLLRDWGAWLLGAGLFVVIVAPWYALAESRNPGYLKYFLLEENVLRYVTPRFGRSGEWYFYLGMLAAGCFPWTVLLYGAFKTALTRIQERGAWLLLLWAVAPLVVFSLSRSKMPGYILPLFPALAILIAEPVTRMLASSSAKARWPLSAAWMLVVVVLSAIAIAVSRPHLLAARLRDVSPEVLAVMRYAAWPLLPVGLALACVNVGGSLWARRRWYYVTGCACFCVVHLFLLAAVTPISQTRSSQRLAEAVAPLVEAGDQLIIFDAYLASLPFYLRVEQPVRVVPPVRFGSILGSLYIAEKAPQPARGAGSVVLSVHEFLRVWRESHARLLVFVKEDDLAYLRDQLGTSPRRLLSVGGVAVVTNQ